MAAELRWILLALSVVLLAGIWWWGRRRSSQAPGDAQMRELTPSIEPQRPAAAPRETVPEIEPETEWGVPPFEPLSIHTHEYERVPVLDGPMMVSADRAPSLSPGASAPPMSAAPTAAAAPSMGAAPAPAPLPRALQRPFRPRSDLAAGIHRSQQRAAAADAQCQRAAEDHYGARLRAR